MTIKLKDNIFINCGTGVSAPDSVDIEAEGNKAFNTNKMFDIKRSNEYLKWFQRPFGIVTLSVIAILIGAFFIFKFNWN
jgi:hypothetical protein